MTKENKDALVENALFIGTIISAIGFGYFIGKSKWKSVTNNQIFAFTVPSRYNKDEFKYFYQEVCSELKKRDYKISDEEFDALLYQVRDKTDNISKLTNELFQIDED